MAESDQAENTLTDTLAGMGITHERDCHTGNTGKHVLIKDGMVIGRFTAHEAWEWIEAQK